MVSIFDADIIIFTINIKLGEDLCPLEFIHKIKDKGEGVYVTNGVFIHIVIILARTEISVFFVKKRKRMLVESLRGKFGQFSSFC